MNKIHHILITYKPSGYGESITVYRQHSSKTYAFNRSHADKFIIDHETFKYSWHERDFMVLY